MQIQCSAVPSSVFCALQAASPPKLNVLFLFMDSVSRRHFFRRLPKSVKALEEMHESGHSELYQFFRFHSVGFHTGPNSRAFYTGTNGSTSGDFSHIKMSGVTACRCA